MEATHDDFAPRQDYEEVVGNMAVNLMKRRLKMKGNGHWPRE